jgi:dipeptidase E
MPKTIVAIGGGRIRNRGTAAIDREIIRLANKKNPKLLFIPTATSDSEIYWEHVQKHFGTFLKCRTDVLSSSKNTLRESRSGTRSCRRISFTLAAETR